MILLEMEVYIRTKIIIIKSPEQFYIYSHIQFHVVYAVLIGSLSGCYRFVFTKHGENDHGRGLSCGIWYRHWKG